jgi:lipid-A-disaccharide synthase
MAKALRKKGYKGKLIHYIAPTVWAHGKERIQHMASTLDMLLTIFPFEGHSFCRTSLRVEYVGNPLSEYIDNHKYVEKSYPEKLVSVFPGSRTAEIERNFPALLEAAIRLQQDDPDLHFAISQMESTQPLLTEILSKSSLKQWTLVPQEQRYEMMKNSQVALAKSGTVTLELALHTCPSVVVYNLTPLNRLIAKYILRLRLPHYCIVNILTGNRTFPELIEKGFSSENVYKEAKSLLENSETRLECIQACTRLKELLSTYRPSEKAAHHIAGILS